jgi:hypothetical protein
MTRVGRPTTTCREVLNSELEFRPTAPHGTGGHNPPHPQELGMGDAMRDAQADVPLA